MAENPTTASTATDDSIFATTALVERLRERVPPGEAAALEGFATLLLERASPDFVERTNDEVLAGLCQSAFRFVAARGEGPRVRVYDPKFEQHGWDSDVTVIETLLGDRPFIVDTIRLAVQEAGGVIRLSLHPILPIRRDRDGALLDVGKSGDSARPESFVHMQVERLSDSQTREALQADLRARLADVVLATDDHAAMRRAVAETAAELRRATAGASTPPAAEIAAFLEWLDRDNFVFLGCRDYRVEGTGDTATVTAVPGSGVGILRKSESSLASPVRLCDLPPDLQRHIRECTPLLVTKTNRESPVHRRAHMDSVGIRSFSSDGQPQWERRVLGLFTSRAYAEEPATVPVLRSKLQSILAAERTPTGSHHYKAVVALFNSLPKEVGLALSPEDLHHDIQAVQAAERSGEVQLTTHADGLGRGLYVMVTMPRDRASAELERRAEATLKRLLHGTLLDRHVILDESPQTRIHLYLAVPPEVRSRYSTAALRDEIREVLRTWDDRLRDALSTKLPATEARRLAERYTAMLPAEYKSATTEHEALHDIERIEALLDTREPQVMIFNPTASPFSTIKVCLLESTIVLSDFLPVLENLGLRVFAQDSIGIDVLGVEHIHLYAFDVLRRDGERLDPDGNGARIGEAILAERRGRMANDPLNHLVSASALSWDRVSVLRAYCAHATQSRIGSRAACTSAMAAHPACAEILWELFATRFDPSVERSAEQRQSELLPEIEERFLVSLDGVETVQDDRILRAVFATMAATVRTNHFAARSDGAISIKIESARLDHLPRPRPLYEIFVYAPHTEGVHLRADRVARGGIRLTDRSEDYRTEVLGLMKTQMAKNAVIVPTGAKGGFLVRHRESGARATSAVIAAYRTFISSLLDLTDNLVQGRLTRAAGIHYDGPDSYLVVAADKGTATFSDLANEIAAEHGFWLGDAFASGGSNGYDHKKIGITARGTWESVRRHFRELGRDADRDPITVIGIGDMSGDVFGNGMLCSSNLRLRAAFNHRHIFLDPDPDPDLAHAERERLFALPRSGWNDYDPGRISDGGGVHARAAKRIELSAPVRRMLDVEAEALSGEELIRSILCMPADLLWNGGIGTYVKASTESHAEAGDAANDGVRVDAPNLRAGVVGEGGNLGFTQRARVEYALSGGRINTDAIDNAGGVTMSDHEVNLKIALAPLVESGRLSTDGRNGLLSDLTGEVTDLVLRQNVRQALALSREQTRSQSRLIELMELMRELEAEGILDRALEGLPTREMLRQRRSSMLGLTRPELAVLLAHTKLGLQKAVLSSNIPDDPHVEQELFDYFPPAVAERDAVSLKAHPLHREIVAVQVVNRLVDTCGTAFVSRMQRDTGHGAVEVIRAWTAAASLVDLREIYTDLLIRSTPLSPETEVRILYLLETALERAGKWLVQTRDESESVAHLVARFREPVRELFAELPGLLRGEPREGFASTVEDLAAHDVDDATATRIAGLLHLGELMEISHVSRHQDVPLTVAASTYYRVGDVFDIDWVQRSLEANVTENRWERRAAVGLLEGLMYARRSLTHDILACRSGAPVEECLATYNEARAEQLEVLRELVEDVKSAPRPSLAALVVIMREIGRLCGRS